MSDLKAAAQSLLDETPDLTEDERIYLERFARGEAGKGDCLMFRCTFLNTPHQAVPIVPKPMNNTAAAARKYTLAEIDEMRRLVRNAMQPRWHPAPGYEGFSPKLPEVNPARVEDRLRTYMTAGLGPEDLSELRSAHE